MTILDEAKSAVFGDRQESYGPPEEHFTRVAAMWTAYLHASWFSVNEEDLILRAHDVPAMMVLFKMCRLMESPNHRDSLVDAAGYVENFARCVGEDKA